MNMRTPLARVRGFGSARSGTGHWWLQRLTAIANVPLVMFLILFVLSHLGQDRAAIAASLHNPLVATGLILALVSFTMHMRLGMQIIIEDYVHGHGARLVLLLANTFYPFALAATGVFAILKLSLGA
jgi:succinate dehydrogenase / fumarate reductase membrane anchor subunit